MYVCFAYTSRRFQVDQELYSIDEFRKKLEIIGASGHFVSDDQRPKNARDALAAVCPMFMPLLEFARDANAVGKASLFSVWLRNVWTAFKVKLQPSPEAAAVLWPRLKLVAEELSLIRRWFAGLTADSAEDAHTHMRLLSHPQTEMTVTVRLTASSGKKRCLVLSGARLSDDLGASHDPELDATVLESSTGSTILNHGLCEVSVRYSQAAIDGLVVNRALENFEAPPSLLRVVKEIAEYMEWSVDAPVTGASAPVPLKGAEIVQAIKAVAHAIGGEEAVSSRQSDGVAFDLVSDGVAPDRTLTESRIADLIQLAAFIRADQRSGSVSTDEPSLEVRVHAFVTALQRLLQIAALVHELVQAGHWAFVKPDLCDMQLKLEPEPNQPESARWAHLERVVSMLETQARLWLAELQHLIKAPRLVFLGFLPMAKLVVIRHRLLDSALSRDLAEQSVGDHKLRQQFYERENTSTREIGLLLRSLFPSITPGSVVHARDSRELANAEWRQLVHGKHDHAPRFKSAHSSQWVRDVGEFVLRLGLLPAAELPSPWFSFKTTLDGKTEASPLTSPTSASHKPPPSSNGWEWLARRVAGLGKRVRTVSFPQADRE